LIRTKVYKSEGAYFFKSLWEYMHHKEFDELNLWEDLGSGQFLFSIIITEMNISVLHFADTAFTLSVFAT